MVSLLHKDVIHTNGKSVSIVFPVHALTIPIAVKQFLKKTDMSSSEYLFAIATRLGIVFRDFKKIDKILKRKNRRLDSHYILNMYSNDVKDKQYKSPIEADISKIEALVQKQLDLMQRIIVNKEISKEKDSSKIVI